MSNITIAVDVMGSDNGIGVMIDGCMLALNEIKDLSLVLIGKEELIKDELKNHKYEQDRIKILNATEEIKQDEKPVEAIKTKKDSSMVVGLQYVKEKKADGFVSTGNTGALLTGATTIVGRIKGIKRPVLGALIPHNSGYYMLVDCGANVEPKAVYLKQFAIMGSIYYENMLDKNNPTVGLVNVGVEKGKGTAFVNEVYDLLDDTKNINFTGFIEASQISKGDTDVIVTDAFTGNVILKHTEGFTKNLGIGLKEELTRKIIYKLPLLFLIKPFKAFKERYDYKEIGGAPLLGLNNLVVKSHGSSDKKALKGAIKQCYKFVKNDITNKIIKELEDEK